MSPTSHGPFSVALALVVLCGPTAAFGQAAPVASATPVAAPDKRACSDAFETAQVLKSVGKLDEAIVQATTCAAPACPKAISVPCAGWRTEWDALLGEVTFEVTDETGQTTQKATLVVDAKPALDAIPSTLRLAPGPHAFRLSRPGRPDQTSSVVLAERQRVTLKIAFPRATEEAPPPLPIAPGPATTRPARIPLATWALGGVGVAGLAVFSGFALAGRSSQKDLESTCSPRCSPDQAAPTKTKYLVADIGLGVGVLALAGATYFALRPTPSAVAAQGFGWTSLSVDPRVGGATAALAGRF